MHSFKKKFVFHVEQRYSTLHFRVKSEQYCAFILRICGILCILGLNTQHITV